MINYTELMTKGYAKFNDPEMFIWVNLYLNFIPKVKRESSWHPIGGKFLLTRTQDILAEKYLDGFSYTNGYCDAWSGIDSLTDKWHNDGREGCNTAFLMYMSDLPEEVGGGLSVKHIDDKTHTTIWPKKYDIVVLNQADHFIHRVEPMKQQVTRHVCHIEYNVG